MAYRNVCDIAQQLDDALAWLAAANIRLPVGGRFAKYRATLSQACRARLVGPDRTDVAAQPSLEELYTAICETSDLWQITNLPQAEIAQHAAKLQRIIKGEASYIEQEGQDPARDIAFQLVTAALFSRGGATVTLEEPSDVNASLAGTEIFVECKRPTTIPALADRIKKGYTQLGELQAKGLRAFCLIAIDLTVLINPEFKILRAKTEAQAGVLISQAIHDLAGQASADLAAAARDSVHKARVDCFLFRVLCMTVDLHDKNPRVGEFWRIASNVDLGSPRGVALTQVLRHLPGFAPLVHAFGR